VTLLNGDGRGTADFAPGDRLTVRIGYDCLRPIERPIFEVWFHSADGTDLASHTTDWDQVVCPVIQGSGYFDFIVEPLPLMPGRYVLSAAITAADGVSRYDWHFRRYWLRVVQEHYSHGTMYLPHEWRGPVGGPGEGAGEPADHHERAR
jgi:ABC-2 type transport system ATP-binding protein/lipopolysaccharide transport system ATP-binding protein